MSRLPRIICAVGVGTSRFVDFRQFRRIWLESNHAATTNRRIASLKYYDWEENLGPKQFEKYDFRLNLKFMVVAYAIYCRKDVVDLIKFRFLYMYIRVYLPHHMTTWWIRVLAKLSAASSVFEVFLWNLAHTMINNWRI
jgi:hypothetical protein